MYDTVGGGSIRRKVLVHLLCDDSMTHSFQVETETSQKSPKYCLVTVVTCVTMILLVLVGAVLHLTHGEESHLERHLYTKCFFSVDFDYLFVIFILFRIVDPDCIKTIFSE